MPPVKSQVSPLSAIGEDVSKRRAPGTPLGPASSIYLAAAVGARPRPHRGASSMATSSSARIIWLRLENCPRQRISEIQDRTEDRSSWLRKSTGESSRHYVKYSQSG
eukprot:3454635-Prymnesium_polylepis.2